MRTTYQNTAQGVTAESPRGLRASYLFRNDGVVTRLDMPSTMFPDNQARLLIHDTSHDTTLFLLKHNLRPDPYVPGDAFQDAFANSPLEFSFALQDRPFMKMTADRFIERTRAVAFDLTEQSEQGVTMTRTLTTPTARHTLSVYFDAMVGAVTNIEELMVAEEMTQQTLSELRYADVQGIEDAAIPFEIHTTSSIELNSDIEPLSLPIPDRIVVVPEGEAFEPEVPEGMEIADEFISPVGQGQLDVTKLEVEQTIRYEDIRINEVAADFFLIGGNQ